ncbi:aquaporin-like protein [Polyporus arcularius HHB13444]|uniref:Aquaporin-like protein n=1 Tax=Polyporus arcularius HHB13444 TaxID=1314778 RepID=A0A5C3PKL0_9APHY|nr:aquaporin-like protein [Polyporus arcularius HHB13444]
MSRSHLFPTDGLVHLADIKPRSNIQILWESQRRRRVHWFSECAAEFFGVFFFVFGGVGSAASYHLNPTNTEGLSSVFQVGMGYAMGVLFAFVVAAQTSGGHFNPGVSIAFVLMRRMSLRKALRYIVAQVLGAYVACLLIYAQYRDIIKATEQALAAAGTLDSVLFTPNGPAGVFAIYVTPGTNLGQVFLNEFVCDFMIGLVIWAVDDPTNFTVSPLAAPWLIAFVYALMVWSYSRVGVSTNSARDVGARLMALTIWGREAGGGPYAAITALTNISATLLAAVFYEAVLADYSRTVTPAHADFMAARLAHDQHGQGLPIVDQTASASTEKVVEGTLERV